MKEVVDAVIAFDGPELRKVLAYKGPQADIDSLLVETKAAFGDIRLKRAFEKLPEAEAWGTVGTLELAPSTDEYRSDVRQIIGSKGAQGSVNLHYRGKSTRPFALEIVVDFVTPTKP